MVAEAQEQVNDIVAEVDAEVDKKTATLKSQRVRPSPQHDGAGARPADVADAIVI